MTYRPEEGDPNNSHLRLPLSRDMTKLVSHGRMGADLCDTAVLALYFNVFVLVVQLFEKVPALKALAPTPSWWEFWPP